MDRYVIMQKLGWGHFSTVWLARDFKYDTYVAIKVQKSANHYLDAAFDEVELLQKAAKYSGSEEWKERLRKIHGVADHSLRKTRKNSSTATTATSSSCSTPSSTEAHTASTSVSSSKSSA